jgi:hypothetical protein
MKKILFIVLLSFFVFSIEAGKPESLKYDIECAGNGTQGSYLIKVWVYGKTKKVNSEALKKAAVHGVIFKGFSGKDGCVAQKPMAQSPTVEHEKADFFNAFFGDERAFAKYVTEVNGTTEVVKVGKEYKTGAVISISKDLLRSDLEAAGIIRGLTGGF